MTKPGRATLPTVVAWGAVFLAIVVGMALLAALLLPGGRSAAAVGNPIETRYGTFTVVRQAGGFVPRTQGPPTMAKMMGQVGRPSLQVWVRLVNSEGSGPVPFSPGQVSLVIDGLPRPLPPAGSTLGDVAVPAGSVIEGQVWFDVGDAEPGSARWLRYAGPDEARVTVRLSSMPEGHDQPGHDDTGGHDKPTS